ncbi:Protein Omannosyltransferase 1like, partial [Caligus rogercresseyi]
MSTRFATGQSRILASAASLCYGYKDVNNWWIVKRPDREDLAVHEPLDIIRDGDVIQL